MAQADVLTPAGEVRTRQGTFPNTGSRPVISPASPATLEKILLLDVRGQAAAQPAGDVSYGLLGLIGAIERYDPDRDVKFETYAIARKRKSPLSGGFLLADDGTRTHDLLHGKQTL